MAPSQQTLPPDLQLGPIRLAVNDVERSIGFYQDAIGLRLHRRNESEAAMGVGEHDLLVLTEEAASSRPHREAGLYHYCLLFPTREELARAATRLATTQTPIQGASDHGTHEAIYLADVDGHGIELAADRPRELWPDMRTPAGYAGGPAPLRLEGLLATISAEPPRRHAEPGLAVGHVHLHVGDIEQAIGFYRDVVGFELMVDLGSAAFLSIGGYHHHLGVNVWHGRGLAPASPGALGLREWTLVLPSGDDVAAARRRLEAAGAPIEERPKGFRTRDPWAIPLAIVA